MKATERRALIEARILAAGEVDFASLADEFEVSEMTIRRDVDTLEERDLVRRVAGGAIAYAGRAAEPAFSARALSAAREKTHIANAVVRLLRTGETVILDSGSTALAVARAVVGRDLQLTVVTPSILVAMELADEPDTTVLLLGGEVRPKELSLIGPETQRSLAGYNCDTYVMGVGGLAAAAGATEYHRGESAVKEIAISSAERVIAAVDASKLGQVRLVRVCGLEAIDTIVSDGGHEDPTLLAAEEHGIEVIHVAAPAALEKGN